jgi:hypothetical protein
MNLIPIVPLGQPPDGDFLIGVGIALMWRQGISIGISV